MTTSPDKLLSLARESGGAVHDMGRGLYAVTFGEVSLPEFVERIRLDVIEKCAKACDSRAELNAEARRKLDGSELVALAIVDGRVAEAGRCAAAIRSISTTESKGGGA
jgi:hypothetical protein